MKEIIFIALVYQRRLIYYPVALDPSFVAERIVVDNQGTRLQGWVLNPGQRKAVIYFGGNSEMITHRRGFFEDVFRDYSVYLINYRGYGDSEGSPSEAGLFSDALAIYDQLSPRHQSISAYGRSLGSGVAVYLAARRPLEKLILLTPYDSVAAVAHLSDVSGALPDQGPLRFHRARARNRSTGADYERRARPRNQATAYAGVETELHPGTAGLHDD
jgi:pimeloyl-ACP methyl ester carboxylesterase